MRGGDFLYIESTLAGMADDNDLTGLDSNLLLASLSYIGVLVLIPLISDARKNSFIAFHARQGLVIFLLEVIAVIASNWLSFLGGLLFALMLVASVMGLFTCLHGERRYIPGIGKIADLFSI